MRTQRSRSPAPATRSANGFSARCRSGGPTPAVLPSDGRRARAAAMAGRSASDRGDLVRPDAASAAAHAGRPRLRRSPAARRPGLHARRAGRGVRRRRRMGAGPPRRRRSGGGACCGARNDRGRGFPLLRARRDGLPAVIRVLVALVGLAVVFAVGIAVGESINDGSTGGGTQTLVRTLQPLPLAPAARETVTVTTPNR